MIQPVAGQRRRSRAWSSASDPIFPTTAAPIASASSSASAARSRSTSAGSTRTRAASELFHFFQHYMSSKPTTLQLVLAWQVAAADPRPPARAASRLHLRPGQVRRDGGGRRARSCRRTSRACRWWRSRRGRSASRCWPTRRCDVLQGQCVRSNAGLFYEDYAEFAETLSLIDSSRSLREALGQNGRTYFRTTTRGR